MTRLLDPLVVYSQGLDDFEQLVGIERLVFVLQDFDNLMEMEGWEHFFLYERHFAWYAEMKDWLRQIGATESLAILLAYEAHVQSCGFEVSPASIETLLGSNHPRYDHDAPDWTSLYCNLRSDRWQSAIAFLSIHGATLQRD